MCLFWLPPNQWYCCISLPYGLSTFSSALSILSDLPSYPETRGGRGAPAFLLLLLPQSKAFTATAKPRCDHRWSDRRWMNYDLSACVTFVSLGATDTCFIYLKGTGVINLPKPLLTCIFGWGESRVVFRPPNWHVYVTTLHMHSIEVMLCPM